MKTKTFLLMATLGLSPLMAEEGVAVSLASYQCHYTVGGEAAQCGLLVTAPEGKLMERCKLSNLSIRDGEGQVVSCTSQSFVRLSGKQADRGGVFAIDLQDVPDSATLYIEGAIELVLADGEETHPPETLAYGEEKKMSFGGSEMAFLRPSEEVTLALRQLEEREGALRGITYQRMDRGVIKDVEWLSSSGEPLESIGCFVVTMRSGVVETLTNVVRALPEEETFQVRVTTYKNATEEKIPVRFRLNLSTMQVTNEKAEEP